MGGDDIRKSNVNDNIGRIITVPNIMSFFRLCLVPVIVIAYRKSSDPWILAFLVAFSGITDVLDGMIARRFNQISNIGKILDPVADKLTQFALLYVLSERYSSMWFLIFFMLFKEIVQGAFGYLVLKRTSQIYGAQWFGKLSTVLLFVMALLLITFDGVSSYLADISACVCALALLMAFILYIRFFIRALYTDNTKDVRESILKGIGFALWIAFVVAVIVFKDRITVDAIAEYAPDNLFIAALCMIGLFALKSLTIVFASAVLFAACAVIFPLPAAVLVSIGGIMVMVLIPYYIGRHGGNAELKRLCSKYPKIRILETMSIENELSFTLLVRMNAAVNYDVGSMYMGARGFDVYPYLLGSIIGMLPQMIFYLMAGEGISKGNYYMTAIALGVNIAMTVASLLLWKRKSPVAVPDDNKS